MDQHAGDPPELPAEGVMVPAAAAPLVRLAPTDYRSILSILETVGRATSVTEFRLLTLDALDEHLGYQCGTFFIGGPPHPGFQATDGVTHGLRQVDLEEYVEVWAPRNWDPFVASTAQALMARNNIVGLDEIARELTPNQRDYLEHFLLRQGRGQLMLWLETGTPDHGYVSLFAARGREFGLRDRLRLLALRPHLANLLRPLLSEGRRGLSLDILSPRETEVAELVGDGWSNRAIAQHLGIGEDTVKKHLTHIFGKLRVHNRTQIALVVRTRAES
jgi:DNA-binding CsgD family transcriptional regulator